MRKRASLLVPMLLVGLVAGAQVGRVSPETLSVGETAEARQALRETVLEAGVGRLSGLSVAPVRQRIYNTTVEVATRTRTDTVDIVLRVARVGSNRGAFTLTRSRRDGRSVEFRIQTRDDPGSYLVARPLSDRTTLDVYHLQATTPLYRGVILPVRFTDLITSPLERIVALTQAKIDWVFLLHDGEGAQDRAVESLAEEIRSRLTGLRDADDGAIDEAGRYVSIATEREQEGLGGLNCSGFVKWLVDGFYYPLVGRNTRIDSAKRTPEDTRGNTLSSALYYMDPYFGLDWTRNLVVLLDAARGRTREPSPEAYDVRSVERMSYTEDLGYPVRDLRLLLYTLAVRDPGMIYLASVNGVIDGEVGLRQHYHTLALLPYFDRDGRFRVAVFERIRETDLDSVLRRYDGHQIHLVRLDAAGAFRPLDLP